MDTGVHDMALLQGGAERTMQPVLEVKLPLPLDHMGKQVTVKRGVFIEQRRQVKSVLGSNELVQSDLVRWKLGPVPHPQPVVGVRARVTDPFENHPRESRPCSAYEPAARHPSRTTRELWPGCGRRWTRGRDASLGRAEVGLNLDVHDEETP